MPNIRIKDIPTTASASSSTDFLALDGSGSGTRKLNAFSPTFGGNLTVSGTTDSSSTTTGSLITSGGLGVAKAGYFGGNIVSANSTNTGNLDIAVANTNTGAAANSRLYAYNGSYQFVFELPSTGFTTSGQRVANRAYLWTDGAQGLTLHTINGSMRFVTGNPGTVAGTIDSSQNWSLSGNLTVSGTGTQAFSGAIQTTGGIGTTTASSAILDYSSGARVIARGASAGAYGVVKIAGTDSAGSAAITGGLVATFDSSNGATTLSGNLTVSGTGDSRFAGKLAVGTSPLADRMFYVSGNTGTSGASQFSAVINPTLPNTVTTSAYGLYLATNIASGATVTNAYSLYVAAPTYAGSTVTNKWGLYIEDTNKNYVSGNLLIGTTTDSANGKLQLADHTTSAGGIGFGTRISLHSGGANKLIITDTTGTNPYLEFREGANPKLQLFTLSSTAYLSTVGATPLILRTNETTALTIDTSQRTILAGALRLANTYVATPQVSTGYVTIQDSTGTTYKVLVAT